MFFDAETTRKPRRRAHSAASLVARILGHIFIAVGGTGWRALQNGAARWETFPSLPPTTTIVVDTDRRDEDVISSFADDFVLLTIDHNELATCLAEPEKQSDVAREIVTRFRDDITGASLQAGAGTRRYVTQFLWEQHPTAVRDAIARAVVRLRQQGVTSVQIHIVGSDGGATGSALSILIPHMLSKRENKELLLLECRDLQLNPPIVYLIDTTCHVRDSPYAQDEQILANKFYTVAYAEHQLGLYSDDGNRFLAYLVMFGNGNQAKYLKGIREVQAEAGLCLAEQLRFHDVIQAVQIDFLAKDKDRFEGRNGISVTD